MKFMKLRLVFLSLTLAIPFGTVQAALSKAPGTGVPVAPNQILYKPIPESYAHTNYQNDLKREIQITEDGAVGDYWLHKVRFNSHLGDEWPITITTPKGRVYKTRPTFLAVRNTRTGEACIIAEVQAPSGEVIGSEEVVYRDAFSGIKAHILYKYTRNELVQDIVLEEQPEDITGWASEDCVLEMWTAWEGPDPSLRRYRRAVVRQASPEAALVEEDDELIDLGGMSVVGAGTAYRADKSEQRLAVAKTWNRIRDDKGCSRTYLIEVVDFHSAKAQTSDLPRAQRVAGTPHKDRSKLICATTFELKAPAGKLTKNLLAQSFRFPDSSFILDYTLNNGYTVPDSPILWLSGEGDCNDEIWPYANTYPEEVTYGPGLIGNGAYFFEGASAYVEIDWPSSKNMQTYCEQFTLHAWIEPYSWQYAGTVFSSWGETDGLHGWNLELGAGGTIYFTVSPDGWASSAISLASTSILYCYEWTHLVATVDEWGMVSLYVNGNLEAQGYVTWRYNGAQPFYAGGRGGAYSFDGMIDEIGIYDRAFSPTEVTNLYSASLTAITPIDPQPLATNLPCQNPPSGITAWWLGNDNRDFKGTNNLVYVNGAYSSDNGVVGKGYYLDGIDDFLLVSNAPALNPTNAMTLETWFAITTSSTGYGYLPILSKASPDSSQGLQYRVYRAADGKLYAHLKTASTVFLTVSSATPQLNTWYHLALTYDSSIKTMTLYLNGIPEGVCTRTNAGPQPITVVPEEPLFIGAWYESYQNRWRFPGRIDEPTIYDRALSGTEISAIFMSGSHGKCRNLPANGDYDSDGMPNWWEEANGLDPFTNDSGLDKDSDSISNLTEWKLELNPVVPDNVFNCVLKPRPHSNVP